MVRKRMTPRGPTPQALREIQNAAEISTRDRRILLLRLAGFTIPRIAEEIGLSEQQTSYVIKAALRKVVSEPAKQVMALQRARAESVLTIAWEGLQRAGGDVERGIAPDDRAIVAYLASVDRAMARLDIYYNIARSEATEDDYKRLARESSDMEEMFVRFMAVRKARLGLPSPDGNKKEGSNGDEPKE